MIAPMFILPYNKPLLLTSTHLTLTKEEMDLFHPSSIVLEDENTIEGIIIGFAQEEHSHLAIMSSRDILMDSIENTALLCEVNSEDIHQISVEDGTSLFVVPISPIHYTFTWGSEIFSYEDSPLAWKAVSKIFYMDLFEGYLKGHIEETINQFLLNNRILSSSLKEILHSDYSIQYKVDALVEEYIPLSKWQMYIQYTDFTDKWQLLFDYLIKNHAIFKNHVSKTVSKVPPELPPESPPVSAQKSPKNQTIPEKIELSLAPASIKESLLLEANRLLQLPPTSQEAGMIRDYMNIALSLPWGVTTKAKIDFKALSPSLNKTHFGLDDVKRYLMEHLVIEDVKGSSCGTVLCFVGPPGTGKSSIAKTLALSAGRRFGSIALGGLSDEAEIRGHRRTYIASRPGRFISSIKTLGTFDPLLLLDEIDKIDPHRGSPSSALLELLDPEQNHAFIDRYLEFPVDMSNVMYICTANEEHMIPGPLKDRMELITFRSYTKDERLKITKDFIYPKIVSDYNISKFDIEITDEVFNKLSDSIFVRQIEKKLSRLLRMAVTNIYINDQPKQLIDIAFASEVLGIRITEKKPIGF